ncbi:hypothetical protein PR048_018264 [Dryococelus australis]|uniref:Uncharacterized protein n=1 Tax=Dryococelus australis TaxID=614101 RepID=A0ABQ9HBV3_9NEOP|nr:hypothetical protein PR048_018264 [Dryococelus australis]
MPYNLIANHPTPDVNSPWALMVHHECAMFSSRYAYFLRDFQRVRRVAARRAPYAAISLEISPATEIPATGKNTAGCGSDGVNPWRGWSTLRVMLAKVYTSICYGIEQEQDTTVQFKCLWRNENFRLTRAAEEFRPARSLNKETMSHGRISKFGDIDLHDDLECGQNHFARAPRAHLSLISRKLESVKKEPWFLAGVELFLCWLARCQPEVSFRLAAMCAKLHTLRKPPGPHMSTDDSGDFPSGLEMYFLLLEKLNYVCTLSKLKYRHLTWWLNRDNLLVVGHRERAGAGAESGSLEPRPPEVLKSNMRMSVGATGKCYSGPEDQAGRTPLSRNHINDFALWIQKVGENISELRLKVNVINMLITFIFLVLWLKK